ncbi:hypothetical protein BKA63DRAFT_116932 [Paraphoma chrysanthemicola]|nr:hypothetical protein BKA63DRAFT_116932 [Paraphoma chrysanthemicola]
MSNDFMRMLQNLSPRSNRTLSDLQNSNDQLSGMDGMELRGWFSQTAMIPTRDLTDPLGAALLSTCSINDLKPIKTYIQTRTQDLGSLDTVIQEMYAKRWGPTKMPIYNVILPFFISNPDNSDHLLNLTRYLAETLRVPVDGTDITGSSALYWSISTKPYALPPFAQILFDAGSSVNQRNRFGATTGGEIGQVDFAADMQRNVDMLRWYLEHGGDVDGKDNDGMNVRMLVDMMRKRVPGMYGVLENGKGERGEGVCGNCGRREGERKLALCKRCKGVRYCSVECQKVDWRGHKKGCKAGA